MSINAEFRCFRKSSEIIKTFIECRDANLNPCLIITADRNGGKTTRFREVTALLLGSVSGFIAESNEDKSVYRAGNIISGRTSTLMEESAAAVPEDFIHGRYIVHQQRFNSCIDEIMRSYKGEIIAIDEVGKIELNGKGWFRLMEFAWNRPLIITVREQFLPQTAMELLGNRTVIILDKPQGVLT
ncbi:MAG: hypothetical protein B0D92_01400 [Spirochaeta sp. LUC14_002_19_P3]|nr:MAG: hypothetical protein B0D92_01400 [Spirochaeta sp. LUC14_002_19_P3]